MLEIVLAMVPPDHFSTYSVGLIVVLVVSYVLLLGRAPLIRRFCFVVGAAAMILGFAFNSSGPKSSFTPLMVFGVCLNLASIFIRNKPLKKPNPRVEPGPGLWDQEMDR